MTDKRPSSAKARRECFEANKKHSGTHWMLQCHICEGWFNPVSTDWEAEHVIPHAFGGEELKPAHVKCHKTKTADDVGKIAKAKRVSDRHLGIKKPPRKSKFAKVYSREEGRFVTVVRGEKP